MRGLVQDCSISSALAMEILQSCTKPSIYMYEDYLIDHTLHTSCISFFRTDTDMVLDEIVRKEKLITASTTDKVRQLVLRILD